MRNNVPSLRAWDDIPASAPIESPLLQASDDTQSEILTEEVVSYMRTLIKQLLQRDGYQAAIRISITNQGEPTVSTAQTERGPALVAMNASAPGTSFRLEGELLVDTPEGRLEKLTTLLSNTEQPRSLPPIA